MAEPIFITCSSCNKQLKVPPAALGKKVRCKKCKAINNVPARTEPLSFEEEAVDAKNPYIVTETSLSPKCPHCAADIEPPDARICLNCGYDLEVRGRRDSRVVYERTAADFIMWHLPTLACFLGIVAIVLGCLFYHFWLPDYVLNDKNAKSIHESRWNYFDDENAAWTGIIFHWGIQVWGIVIGLFLIWKCLVFMYKRLINNFLPPERRMLMIK
jgi:LSD1 subclass zinc finger protein